MTRKRKANDGPQTLKQAKAAFKARGSTAVSTTEKRQLERGAVLLERASRIKEQGERRKDLSKKKEEREAKALHSCNKPPLLGTQRRLDKFGYKSSQFHLGAFLKPKSKVHRQESCSPEPWEEDGVDDDTLLDLAAESPVAVVKPLPDRAHSTPSKSQLEGNCAPTTAEDLFNWDDFLERSSQIAREIDGDHKASEPVKLLCSRIPSFNSGDFDLSVDDVEELDMHVSAPRSYRFELKKSQHSIPENEVDHGSYGMSNMDWQHKQDGGKAVGDPDGKLMPPPKLPARPHSAEHPKQAAHPCSPCVPPGVSLADLESLAGEEIQLSQFDGI